MKIPKLLKKCLKQKNLINIMLIIVIIYLLIQGYKKVFEGNTPLNPAKNKLVLFHMNGCGHCVKFMPEWKKFINEIGNNFQTETIEEGEIPEGVDRTKITGFPTIALMKGNKIIKDYDGPRTVKGLTKFINENPN
tara:strand:+ start:1072 stop:1476 length:405 start_codon:yes stop_codon:yes gene_type:complete